MSTEISLKEAIEVVKKSHPYATKYKEVKEDEALQKLVEVAELLEQVEKCGVKKVVSFNNIEDAIKQSSIYNFNLAIDLCNAEWVRKLEGIEEIITEILVQLYYEETHPIKDYTAEEMGNRKEKAMDEYFGRNQPMGFIPILDVKVDKARVIIYQTLIAHLMRREG